jgi:hypothetical protein
MKLHVAILAGRLSTAISAIFLNFLLVGSHHNQFANQASLYLLWPGLVGIFDFGFINWINLTHSESSRQRLLLRNLGARCIIASFFASCSLAVIMRPEVYQFTLICLDLYLAYYLTAMASHALKGAQALLYLYIVSAIYFPSAAYFGLLLWFGNIDSNFTLLILIEILFRLLMILFSADLLVFLQTSIRNMFKTPRKSFGSIGFTYAQIANFLVVGMDNYYLTLLYSV